MFTNYQTVLDVQVDNILNELDLELQSLNPINDPDNKRSDEIWNEIEALRLLSV